MKKPDFKNFKEKLHDWFKDVIILVKENRRVAICILGFAALVVIAILVSTLVAKKSQSVEAVLSTEEATEVNEYSIPEEALETDAYPEINTLMKKYYQAVADGDVATISSIKTNVDDKERIVIEKKSEYIESYPVVTCYTKRGPLEDTFLVFAYYEVKLVGYEIQAPGLNAWYVCKNENGEYYINDDEQDEKLSEYCKIISVQDDVVDLNNTVNVKFNEILEANPEFATFMEELPTVLTAAVGEELARAEAPETEEVTSTAVEETTTEEGEVTYKKVSPNTVLNVRSSDSGNADKVGTIRPGEEYNLLEEKVNGWSKIEYEGKEAFCKTEYLEVVGEETVTVDSDDNSDDDGDDDSDSKKAADSPSNGSAKATTTIKLRKEASTSSDQLTVIYGGQKVEVLEKKSNGWSKVKYSGKTGYVKSEYLE